MHRRTHTVASRATADLAHGPGRWRRCLAPLLAVAALLGIIACAPASGGPAAPGVGSAAQPSGPSAAPGTGQATTPSSSASAPAAQTPGPASAPAAPAAASLPAPPIRARYAYTAISGSMAPMWVAYDLGLFAKHGLDAEMFYAPSTQTLQAVLAGEADFGLMSTRTTVEARLAGADVTSVGIFTNKVVQSLFGGPGINTIADLRGKRVGITRFGSVVDNSARTLLRTGGLTPPDDVVLLQIGGFPEIIAALQAGAIDGGVLSPPTTLIGRKAGYRELARMQDQAVEYAFTVLVSRKSWVDANPEAARRTARAMAEAAWIFKQQPEPSLRVLKHYLQTEDDDVVADTYAVNAETMNPSLQPTSGSLEAVFAEIAAENPAANALPPADVFDARWADELARDGFLSRLP